MKNNILDRFLQQSGLWILASFFIIPSMVQAQTTGVGINTTGADPDPSSILDVSATDKGVLIPRVALTNVNTASPITSPANGLLVYNTNASVTGGFGTGFYFWGGSSWIKVATGNPVQATLTDGRIWVGNGSNQPAEQQMSGDATLSNTGVLDLSNDAVETSEIQNNAVTNAKLAAMAANTVKVNNTGASANPTDLTVGPNTVLGRQAGNIVAAQVATAQIADNAVDGTKINLTSNANGDLMYYNGTDWVRLAAGSTGQVLQANGAAAPTWVSGDGLFIQNQNAADQTANFRISGTGRANTSFQSPVYTRADAGTVGIRPNTNSTTAVQIQNAAGTSILNVDATNSRVGIGSGITAPDYTLTLGGGGNILGVDNTATFVARNSGGTYEPFLWPRWSDNIMYMNYGSGGMHIRNNASATTMFMTNSNLVGIGTTTVTERLDVAGNVRLTGALRIGDLAPNSGNGSVSVYGNGTGFQGILRMFNNTTGTLFSDGGVVGMIGNELHISNLENSRLVLSTNNVERFQVTGDGRIAMGMAPFSANHLLSLSGGYVQHRSNLGGVFPQYDVFGGWAAGWNFSNGTGEVGFWNVFDNTIVPTAQRGFSFYQQTGASSQKEVLRVNQDGDVRAGRFLSTPHSGTVVVNGIPNGPSTVNLTIPTLPNGFDFTNTVVLVHVSDGIPGNIRRSKLTSLTNIELDFVSSGGGTTRFNYIIFKL
jgi:hypothetical protein